MYTLFIISVTISKVDTRSGGKESEAPRPQGGASRKGSFVHIVPLDPAYKAGLAGHVPVNEGGYGTHFNR